MDDEEDKELFPTMQKFISWPPGSFLEKDALGNLTQAE